MFWFGRKNKKTKEEDFDRSPCEVCGYLTLRADQRGRFDICPVCFWEDDMFHDDPNEPCGGPNHDLTLRQARKNFKEFGACEAAMIPHVRKPNPEEMPKNAASNGDS